MKSCLKALLLSSACAAILACRRAPEPEPFPLPDMAVIEPKPEGTAPFEITRCELSQEYYALVLEGDPDCEPAPSAFPAPQNPVECVTWYDAAYFCNALTRRVMGDGDCAYEISGITRDEAKSITSASVTLREGAAGFRLPTEAEWILAAEGAYSDGRTFWYAENSDSPHELGTSGESPLGLFDMAGNVREWCFDLHEGGPARVARGGSWKSRLFFCAPDLRFYFTPDFCDDDLGFRVCRTLAQEQADGL